MSFSSSIFDFNKKVKRKATFIFRGTALSMLGRIVKLTPVGNPDLWLYKHPQLGYVDYLTYRDAEGYTGGTARGNWHVDLGRSKQRILKTKDKTGSKALGAGGTKIATAELGDTIYITNNLPYIEPLENGWSSQAPTGMVKTTVAEFNRIVAGKSL